MLSPKIISSAQQHETYIQRLLELQRKTHRTPEETETAKLLIVLIADYEARHSTIENPNAAHCTKGGQGKTTGLVVPGGVETLIAAFGELQSGTAAWVHPPTTISASWVPPASNWYE